MGKAGLKEGEPGSAPTIAGRKPGAHPGRCGDGLHRAAGVGVSDPDARRRISPASHGE